MPANASSSFHLSSWIPRRPRLVRPAHQGERRGPRPADGRCVQMMEQRWTVHPRASHGRGDPFWEGIGKVVGPASPTCLQCYPSSLADRSHGEVSDSNVNPACLQYGRSGRTPQRARFRTWFPFREWRFESSLRHLVTKGLTAKNAVSPFRFSNQFGEKLGKTLGPYRGDVALSEGGNRWHPSNSATRPTASSSCTRARSTALPRHRQTGRRRGAPRGRRENPHADRPGGPPRPRWGDVVNFVKNGGRV